MSTIVCATDLPASDRIVVDAVDVLYLAFRVAPTERAVSEYVHEHHPAVPTAEVPSILQALVARGALRTFTDRRTSRYLGAAWATPERPVSRRQTVLALVSNAVVAYGRVVRESDVCEYAARCAASIVADARLTPQLIRRDIHGLAHTGDVLIAGTVRGGAGTGSGSNLYLPASMDARRAELMPREPLTWLDYVARVFAAIWGERRARASALGGPPAAITTAEMRAAMLADLAEDGQPIATSVWHRDLADAMTTVNAMLALARSARPVVRAVPGRAAVWLPIGVEDTDEATQGAFAKDSDRVVEATRRAMVRADAPAVTAKEIEMECELDPSLRLSGGTPLARLLADVARERITGAGGQRCERRTRRIVRVGLLGRSAAYVAPYGDRRGELLEAAKFHVQTQGVMQLARERDLPGQYGGVSGARCPMVGLGRIRLVALRAGEQISDASRILDQLGDAGGARARAELQRLVAEATEVQQQARAWERFRRFPACTPNGIDPCGPTLTALELRDLLAPFSPTAAACDSVEKVVPRYARLIRRVKNPAFLRRQSKDPRLAAEFLFDRVDALFYATRQWGGIRAKVNAAIAKEELGALRDVRFVIAAVESEAATERLRAVVALAFLQGAAVVGLLKGRARNDVDPAVRETALWAYGFAGGPGATELLREAARDDEHARVRKAAGVMLGCGDDWWWRC